MGCDIHWCVEIKNGDHWLGLISSNYCSFPAGERWYSFFAELGMTGRRTSDTAVPLRGLPDDISELTKYSIEHGCWDHSPSWLLFKDFVAAYKRAHGRFPSDDSEAKQNCLFGEYFDDYEKEMRVVFAFDN